MLRSSTQEQVYYTATCPFCHSPIRIFPDEEKVVFTGDPAFCICCLTRKDKERFLFLTDDD